MRPTFPCFSSDASAVFQDDILSIDGTVDGDVSRISEHEGVCGEVLSFFDRNGRIGMNLQVCAHVTAAKGDYIVSVTLNKEASEVKTEGIMRDDEHPHDPSGFKLLEDNMTVFFPSIGKTIPLTDIFRDDGYKSVIFSHSQLTDFAGIGETTKIRTIFRHPL